MKPSNLKLGTAFGIDILLHWTFFILPAVVLWFSISQGDSIHVVSLWMVLLVAILASVLWHELGHSLVARRLGIPILDIMLTPICGLARLERPPNSPRDEVLVALAGPAANCLVSIVLAGLIWLLGGTFRLEPDLVKASLLLLLFWINLALFGLNLLPVFPMDGGRILRAVIAMFIDSRPATLIAARIGQVFSLGAILAGIWSRFYPLSLIGLFLLLTAEHEIRMHRLDRHRQ